jgi:hypothetical protein
LAPQPNGRLFRQTFQAIEKAGKFGDLIHRGLLGGGYFSRREINASRSNR